MILKGTEFNCAPGNTFDHPNVVTDNDDIADLKRPIRMQGDPGEEIAQSVLQRETDITPKIAEVVNSAPRFTSAYSTLKMMTKRIVNAIRLKMLRTSVGAS